MANISLRGKKYRAQVARSGIRRSASFFSFDDALAWATQQERDILGGIYGRGFLAPAPPVHEIQAARIEPGLLRTLEEVLALPRFQPACGVYFLIRDDRVVYVGQSVEVHSRVTLHHSRWKQFDGYTYIPCEPEQLADLERYYIRLLAPELNVAGVPNRG